LQWKSRKFEEELSLCGGGDREGGTGAVRRFNSLSLEWAKLE